MIKIKDNARAWQFTGDMFSAVDIIRQAWSDSQSDSMAPTFNQGGGGTLSFYDPVGDQWKEARDGDWIVMTEGSRVLVYSADAFVFAFNE